MLKIIIKIKNALGIDNSVSNAEKLASTLGGFIGIFLISGISFYFTDASGAALIVPSMGASAVLVFAVPHGNSLNPGLYLVAILFPLLLGYFVIN